MHYFDTIIQHDFINLVPITVDDISQLMQN